MNLTPRVRSLRAQLTLAFGLLVVILSVSLSIGFAVTSQARIERAAGDQLRTAARLVAQTLANGLFERAREVEVVSRAEDVWAQGLGSAAAQRLLARMQASQPDNTWIGVTDTAGDIRAATGGLMVGRNASERPWFSPGLAGPHVGDVHTAKMLAALLPPEADGTPLRFVDFAAPIRVGGVTQGVLVSHGTWRWAHAVVQRLAPDNAAARQLQAFIFDREGKMIYAPGQTLDRHLAADQRLPVMPQDLPARRSVAVVRWADGTRYLTAVTAVQPHTRASDLGWTVVAREPADLAFAEARRSALRALLIGLVSASVAAAIAWRLAGRLSRPLREIAQAARAVGAGTPGATMPALAGSSEVLELAGSLSTMTRRLLDANQDLERRVAARTAELERANEELVRLARHDPLTGLLNRRGFDERLAAALASAERRRAPVSLVVVDADHFKRVNDTHGHDAGDATLVHIADVLRQRVRESDVVARLGGEEFVLLLPDTGVDGARLVADDLVARMGRTAVPTVGRVTVSCGVAGVRVGEDDGSDALRQADEALYRAKAGGRNRVVAFEDAQA